MSSRDLIPILGSERRPPVDGAERLDAPPEDTQAFVVVRLYPRADPPRLESIQALLPGKAHYLTIEEFEKSYGAKPEGIKLLKRFAAENGLEVVEANEGKRLVILSGPVSKLAEAFGVGLEPYKYTQRCGSRQQEVTRTYRNREGPVHVPAELVPYVQSVFGLDDRDQSQSHTHAPGTPGSDSRLILQEVMERYHFPAGATGKGQTIAILEFGSGYRDSDLEEYFKRVSPNRALPEKISVLGGQNDPTGPDQGDGATLDITVAGTVAPGAKIAVYFSPDTTAGQLAALAAAIHDKERRPSVVSISWGDPEARYTGQFLDAMNEELQVAALLGITVCCSSGNDGSTGGEPKGDHVMFPASSPFALACGGTDSHDLSQPITQDFAWNAGLGALTGGGMSNHFPLPDWQDGIGVQTPHALTVSDKRALPDVAGHADGYQVVVAGKDIRLGGTSSVAPLWAGLVALLNQQLGTRLGLLSPLLYTVLNHTLNDVQQGNNAGFFAGRGWDACTGLGTPDGVRLLTALRTLKLLTALESGPSSPASPASGSGEYSDQKPR